MKRKSLKNVSAKLTRAGFAAWQVTAALAWVRLQGRGWRRVLRRVYGVAV